MADIMSFFFPQASNGLTARAESAQNSKSGTAKNSAMQNRQFSPEFFALLQGEISALTSSGQGKITSSDINSMSDAQIDALGEFLGNVEVGENGEMIYSRPDDESFSEPLNILPQSSMRPNVTQEAEIDLTAESDKPRAEEDPAVLDVLDRIRSSVMTTDSDTENPRGNENSLTAFEKLGGLIEQFLTGLPKESRPQQDTRREMTNISADAMAVAVDSNGDTERPMALQIKSDEAEGVSELIATGLSPEKLTALIEKLSGLQTKEIAADKQEAGAENKDSAKSAALDSDVTFTLVVPSEPTPAAEEQNVIFLPRGIVVSENTSSRDNRSTSAPDLNEKTGHGQPEQSRAGENIARALNKALDSLVTNGNMTGLYGEEAASQNAGSGKTSDSAFDRVFSMFEQARTETQPNTASRIPDGVDKSTNLTANQLSTHADAKAAQKLSAGLSTVQSETLPGLQNMSASGAWDTVFPEGIDWSSSTAAQSGQQNAMHNSVQMATMTSLVSQNNAATAAHPSTQMVAATITKAGQNDSKTLTLRLDPPDLGRVQVRMELSEDNVMKAIISSEKPQTHMMLQRDAHVLERALQQSGMDIADGSLDFELAEDGSLFGDNEGRGGENDSGGGSSSSGENSDEDGTLIESKMTWYVDPETGTMHYNLLV